MYKSLTPLHNINPIFLSIIKINIAGDIAIVHYTCVLYTLVMLLYNVIDFTMKVISKS